MNVVNKKVVNQQSLGASFNGAAILVDQVYGFSMHMIYTGTPNGTLKIQCSNDVTTNELLVTNWSDITGASAAITTAGNTFFNVDQVYFKWIRVTYTRTSGTGALDVNYFAKGV